MKSIFKWIKYNKKKQNNCCPGMDDRQAIDFLTDYLLGPDYYIVDPVSPRQANTIIVDEILQKYSKLYQEEKELRNL